MLYRLLALLGIEGPKLWVKARPRQGRVYGGRSRAYGGPRERRVRPDPGVLARRFRLLVERSSRRLDRYERRGGRGLRSCLDAKWLASHFRLFRHGDVYSPLGL